MRAIFVIDKFTDGAETDFATVGEITVGGTLTLVILTTVAGAFGGVVYVALRRWLPSHSPVARGAYFGLLMMFGPGVIFLGEVDLQIFEPALARLPFAPARAWRQLGAGSCVSPRSEYS